ncbi:MAG: hypothetical protein SCK28_10925, partial [Bacillota bacterium]|nr:hypothetical protein [Bacillota bacterium]
VKFVSDMGIKNYQELGHLLFGAKIGKILELVISFILWIGLVVMMSGSGAIFSEHWGLNSNWGIGISTIILWIALFFKGNGVKWLNSLLIPILVVITSYIAVGAIIQAEVQHQTAVNLDYGFIGKNWLLASFIYVAYNMILGVVILSSIDCTERKHSLMGVAIGGLLLGLIGMIKVMALIAFFPEVMQYQIPMLYVAGLQANWLKLLFAVALWSAMVTTAVANGFGLLKRLEQVKGSGYNKALILLIISYLPLAKLQFSNLVAIFYPIFGYLGLLIVGMVFAKIIEYILKK